MNLIPVSTDAGPGAETIVYWQYDQVGIAKVIANYADDLPRADVSAKEFRVPVRSIGNAYGYSIQEIRAAEAAGQPLTARKATAARRAHDERVNRIAWFGDTEHGLQGLLTNPNIPVAAVANDGAGATTAWVNKTPEQMVRDLNDLANGIVDLTHGVEVPDTVLLPIAQYGLIASTRMETGTDTTVLRFFLDNNPYIGEAIAVPELKGAGSGGTDVMIAYRRDPDALSIEVPQPFEQFPAQERGLEFVVPCHSRVGGVVVYYPLSIAIGEGI